MVFDRRSFVRNASIAMGSIAAGCLSQQTDEFELVRNEVEHEAATGGAYPMHQDGPGHTGYVSGDGTSDGGTDLWVSTIEPPATGLGVVLSDDGAFVVSGESRLCALDRTDGSIRWTKEVPAAAVSPPVVADGTVVVSGSAGESGGGLFAYETGDGAKSWAVTEIPGSTIQPTVHDARVYASASDDGGTITALGLESGDISWRQSYAETVGPVAVTADALYVHAGQSLRRLHSETGDTVWRQRVGARTGNFPTVADRTLFAQTGPRTFEACDTETGNSTWTYESATDTDFSACVADDTVYLAGEKLVAIQTRTGAVQWQRTASKLAKDAGVNGENAELQEPVVTDTDLYVGLDEGVVAVDREGGNLEWYKAFRNRTEGDLVYGGGPSTPALGDRTVLVHTTGGDLYALRR